jgi:DnaK suppressor protein
MPEINFLKQIHSSYEVKIGDNIVYIENGYDPREDNQEYMNIKQLAFFKKLLLNWIEQLQEASIETIDALSSINTDRRSVDEGDSANIESEILLELRTKDRYRKLIHRIEETITKIELGTYGYCEETGDIIGIPRLLARPITKYCIAVQSKKEEDEKNVEYVEYNQDPQEDDDVVE